MDRALTSRQRRAAWLSGGIKWLLALGALVTLAAAGRHLLRPSLELPDVRTAVVERGSLEATVTATGTIVPRSEQTISSPVGAEIRHVLVAPGESISRGQVVMELDTTASALELSNLDEQLAVKRAEIRSLELQHADAIRQAESRRELLGIDLESREVRLSRLQRLADTGVVSEAELLEAELDVRRTEVEATQTNAQIESLRQRRDADLERLALDYSILEKQREDQARRVSLSTVKAPRDGIVTELVRDEGAVVAEGQALATIASTESFRVEAAVSDYYGPMLRPNQRVRVSSSTSEFSGFLSRILPAAEDSRLDLFIELDDPAGPAFHTNLRVDIEIVTDRKDNVLKVRRGPALEAAGIVELFVIEGERAIKRRVHLGASERREIEIVEGLEAGDRIIISDMSGYEHLEEIRIR